MEENKQEQVDHAERRKPGGGVWLSHRQIGAGGLVAALVAIAPLKEFVWTREEGKSQTEKIESVEKAVNTLKIDLTARLERSTDKIIDRIKESEERTTKNADRLERRIDGVEGRIGSFEVAARLFGIKPKKSDN